MSIEVYAEESGNLTKIPTSLNKRNLWIIHQKRDSPHKKVGFWLEIRVKDGNKVTLSNIAAFHSFL